MPAKKAATKKKVTKKAETKKKVTVKEETTEEEEENPHRPGRKSNRHQVQYTTPASGASSSKDHSVNTASEAEAGQTRSHAPAWVVRARAHPRERT